MVFNKKNSKFTEHVFLITYKPQTSSKKHPMANILRRCFFFSKLDTMVPHSWSSYFLTEIGYGFIRWGADPISYKIALLAF